MKKISFIFLTFIMLFVSSTYAYSDGFQYMLTSLEIPTKNTNGFYINEEIYNKYNLLVYGNPLLKKEKQRWKETSKGNWTYNGGAWAGTGIRGEYWILGENVNGKEVHNELFPDDYVSGTSPLDWNYIEIEDAEETWMTTDSYHSDIQREYMLNQKLSRYGVTYDLTAGMIGKNKSRIENYATWKTSGSIYTKKKRDDGSIWVATFSVPPMAASAEIVSKLDIENGNTFSVLENENNINISISYGAMLENLSEYVTSSDVKNIQAELLIDNNRVGVTSDSEALNVTGKYTLHIEKSKYPNEKTIEILVKCNAIAETYFNNDIPMYDTKEEVIIIKLGKQDDEIIEVNNVNKRFESGDKPKIASIEIKRISTDSKGNEKSVDLNTAKKTNSQFVCAGQLIYIRVKTLNNTERVTLEIEGDKSITTLDELTKKFEYTEPKERNQKTRYSTLESLKKAYQMPLNLKLEEDIGGGIRYFGIKYVIPYKTKQTLNSWANIREENKNAFEINEDKLFERIRAPYSLVIKAKSEIGITTKRKSLDVFEAWNTIYNRDLSKYVK